MKLSTAAIVISAAVNASVVYAGKAGKLSKGSKMSKAGKTSKATSNAFTSFSYDPKTDVPTPSPSESCQDRLRALIYAVSERMGTTGALDDPNSPQSQARDWIIEECDAFIPIVPAGVLTKQRYGLAVMYFALGGDSWYDGSNPDLDADIGPDHWMSGLNYCEWGAKYPPCSGCPENQLVCDDAGNVLNLNLRE